MKDNKKNQRNEPRPKKTIKTEKSKKEEESAMDTMKTMGTRIAELLDQKKMTQKQLSVKAGITEAAISLYIRGERTPRASVLNKLAEALDTTTDYLLKGITPDAKEELGYAKKLIARNYTQMSKAEKLEIIKLLMGDDDEG